MSFCYIVDSANEMHLRVIAQPCAGVPKTLQNITRLHIVVFYNKSPFNTQVLFHTWWQRRQDPRFEAY